MKPYYESEGITIYHGDALEVLATIEHPVDALVMDPPYASGTRTEASKPASGSMLRAGRFADRPIDLDQMTTTGFVWLMRHIGLSVRDLMPDGASVMSFIDWRQWPNLSGALETCNLRVQAMLVWDKGSIGMGNGFRTQHELICHASKGVPTVYRRNVGQVLRYPREAPEHHPSPKPVALMADLIEVVTAPGDLVLDPFMGSGTTLLAARNLGRRAIGIESKAEHCATAAERLGAAPVMADDSLFAEVD